MQLDNFGSRLRSARLIAGYSLRELAELIDNEVTKQALSKYENNQMQPTSAVLSILAKALNLNIDFFVQDSFVHFKSKSFRKKQSLTQKEEDQILERARAYYDNYNELENILGINQVFINPVKDLIINNYEDVEKAAITLREVWQLGLQPISNLFEMIEFVGIRVFAIHHDDKIDGVSIDVEDGNPLVIVNVSEKPIERIRFTVIHELAHTLLNFSETIKGDLKLVEKLCHYFASCFLLPYKRLVEQIGGTKRTYIKIDELIRIKEYFGISLRALVYRLKQNGIITDNYHKRWSIWLNKTYGTTKEPGEFIGQEKTNRFMQLLDRALAEELITASKAASLSNLSIQEIRNFQPVG
jgi:Zn-dependent peptidase ImmA (M78 family)/DNA-binding XRE family transcriptional regulator